MDVWRRIADRKIEEAMAGGAFDDLAGTGQPLSLAEDPFEDPSLRMAHRLLRNNGFAPAWIEEGKEIDAELESLRADLRRARGEDDLARFRQRISELNRKIAGFNLKTPSAVWHKLPVDADREISGGGSQ
jgi:DnaJ homologue, subfamily C, member 28, conserved domain